jgi:hypothetical protein
MGATVSASGSAVSNVLAEPASLAEVSVVDESSSQPPRLKAKVSAARAMMERIRMGARLMNLC